MVPLPIQTYKGYPSLEELFNLNRKVENPMWAGGSTEQLYEPRYEKNCLCQPGKTQTGLRSQRN